MIKRESQKQPEKKGKKKNHRFHGRSNPTSEQLLLHNLIVSLMGSSSYWAWLQEEIQRLSSVLFETLLYRFSTLKTFKEKSKYMRPGHINRQTSRKNRASDRSLNRLMARVFTKWCNFKSQSVINKFSDNKINSKTRIN